MTVRHSSPIHPSIHPINAEENTPSSQSRDEKRTTSKNSFSLCHIVEIDTNIVSSYHHKQTRNQDDEDTKQVSLGFSSFMWWLLGIILEGRFFVVFRRHRRRRGIFRYIVDSTTTPNQEGRPKTTQLCETTFNIFSMEQSKGR